MGQPSCSLAVLVPTYRSRYLPLLFDSLTAQSDKSFTVIVADDASPEPVSEIVNRYSDVLDIHYVRYQENLGSTNLVKHWNRGLELVNSDWVMVPGDDDCYDANCVENFLKAVRDTNARYSVYKFWLRTIDANGKVTGSNRSHYGERTVEDWLAGEFSGEKMALVDNVFSVEALKKMGGFIEFPVGYFSDTATTIAVSEGRGIYYVAGSFANWRSSDGNISANRPELRAKKAEATVRWIEWLHENRKIFRNAPVSSINGNYVWDLCAFLARCESIISLGYFRKVVAYSFRLKKAQCSSSFWRNFARFFYIGVRRQLSSATLARSAKDCQQNRRS